MAMFITYKDWQVSKELHIGDKEIKYVPNEVIEVQADGDELEFVLRNFSNIPHSNVQRVQTWSGEFARFIIKNW